MALYSQGSAVVQDSRTMHLDAGEQNLSWPVVGAVQPGTFWLSGSGVNLVGFELNMNRGDSGGLLAGRIGRSITVNAPDGASRQGTLVAVEDDTAYVRIDDRIERITAASAARISWPAANNGDNSSGITLHVTADHAGKQKLTATYQTDAPSWQTSYTGRFDPQTGRLKLTGSAIIDNSGHGALNADKAWLVAGDTARAEHGGPRPMMMAKMTAAAPAPAGPPERVGDVYRYSLANGLHVPAGATRSVALIEPMTVNAKRRYRFENYALSDTGNARRHAEVNLSFDNSSGQPLPAGPVRIYDAAHAAQLMGGARIDDTPAGAPVRLNLGGAFDITGTHRVTKQSNDDGAHITQVTVELFNAGDSEKQVTVAERLPQGAQLADNAPKPNGGSAHAPQWRVSLPANGHRTLSYRFTRPQSS
ncbi:hypothetical protein [Salinisphaera sp.]|uniref:DUF4139 domain-containing protein n=1 Tax=Salinisphaera sp. TaxID=1914330 RepID=UPI002D789562|nr:hypothetical protein [Salinisphaera sp.]HET7313898.1 hypothetical protein [Salinisphaera sp.]